MLKTLIHYQVYIIIGILVFPILAFIVYFTKKLIDRARFVKALHNMKKPLIDRINTIDILYETKEKKDEINHIIYEIKNDIDVLKQDIYVSQDGFQLEKIDQIEDEITKFYEQMQWEQTEQKQGEVVQTLEKTPTEAIYQQTTQIPQIQPQQAKISNENFSKFLVVYREKDKVIEEKNRLLGDKNKSIYILQQKLTEAEEKLKHYINHEKNNQNKDKIIEEKIQTINTLKQRLQDVENKFKKIALLHKSITEKEQIKDDIISEKNMFIASLQNKLNDIEKKLENMKNVNEENKDKFINKKLFDIDNKIQAEKRKTRIFIVLFILFLLVGIAGFIFVYNNYIQNIAAYTI